MALATGPDALAPSRPDRAEARHRRWPRFALSTSSGLVRVFAALVNGGGTLLLGRVAGPGGLGVVAFSITVGTLSAMAWGAGVAPTVVRFGADLSSIGRRLRRLTIVTAALAAATAAATVAVIGPQPSSAQLLLAAAVAWGTIIGGAAASRLILAGALARLAWTSLLSVGAGLAAGAFTAYGLGARGASGLTVSALTASAVLTIASSVRNPWGGIDRRPDGDHAPPTRRDVRAFLMRSWFTNAVQMGVLRVDSLMLGALVAPGALGRYALMLKSIEALGMVLQSKASYVFGEVVFRSAGEAVDLTRREVGSAFRWALGLSMGGAALYGIAVPRLLGPEFAPDRWWFAVIALPSLTLLAASVYTSYFAARGSLGIALQGSIGGLAFSLPLYAVLIPRLGLPGACLSSMAVYLLQTAWFAWRFRRLAAGVAQS